MNDTPARKVYDGEVLPPARPTATMPSLPPDTPLGIPLLARVKYEAHARAFRAYIEFREAQQALVNLETGIHASMEERIRAEERLAKALLRQQHLDKILLAEEAMLLCELDDVFTGVSDHRRRNQEAAEDRGFARRIELANLEADALAAEARRDAFKNRKSAASSDAHLSPAQRKARAIERITKETAELRALLIKNAGGEEHLTDDDRDHLDTLNLAAKNQVREILEDL